MKKNAILIAGILCVASASRAQEDASERYKSYQYDTSPGQSSSAVYGDDISADSSRRGGSLDARGYNQEANSNEIESAPKPINPGNQADSSIRGGSIFAREREWNHDMEPSSGRVDRKRHLKADSSIRGGSLEARGAREATRDRNQADTTYPNPTWDHSGQADSATVESDVDLSSSPNWNPGDDQLRDGLDVEAQSTFQYERNNDASVGGSAKAESGSATLEEVELDYQATQQNESSALKHDLNSSDELEKNIAGEFEIDRTEANPDLSSSKLKFEITDPNSLDTFDSSVNSRRSTEIVHDQGNVPISTGSDLSSDIERENREAVGAAAASESGTSNSSDSEEYKTFESKDPALKRADTPLKEGDIDFLYRDNRAHGVGSLSTGEFGAAVADQSATRLGSDERLSQAIKGRLTRESTGVNATIKSDVVRNVQVWANNGEVTLTGTVPSEKDKQMIEMRAAEMPGVGVVKNEITVTPEADAGIRNLERGGNLEDRTSDLQD